MLKYQPVGGAQKGHLTILIEFQHSVNWSPKKFLRIWVQGFLR